MNTKLPVQRPTVQIFENYTPEDYKVWKLLFERQSSNLKGKVSQEYLSALNTIGFTSDKIPDFREIEMRLKPLTGWALKVVPCLSPQKEFFEWLSQKRFTATCWLRSMDQLDYLEEPDMFHDVFGHAPLLSNTYYTSFFEGISKIALAHLDNPKVIEMLGRVYWFTIEFGLISEMQGLKIYGAGIISSSGETENSLSNRSKKHDFDIRKIMHTGFRNDIIQDNYFVVESYQQLFQSLPEMDSVVQEVVRN